MAITTLDGYIASAKQRVQWFKSAARTTVASIPFTVFELAGNPGAGTLNVGNTANGLVPTDAVAGYPIITAFGGTNTGYISKVEYASTVASWFDLHDRVFVAGAYAFNANVTLASQPSYSGRIPNADYTGLQIWVEAVTAFTGIPSFTITYTNQAGTAGKTTGTVSAGAALTLGRMFQLPLAAGDSGVQMIQSVVGSVATVGTFNVMVLRPLWSGRVPILNSGDVHDMLRTGMPQIYENSALYVQIAADSTSSGIPEIMVEIANG